MKKRLFSLLIVLTIIFAALNVNEVQAASKSKNKVYCIHPADIVQFKKAKGKLTIKVSKDGRIALGKMGEKGAIKKKKITLKLSKKCKWRYGYTSTPPTYKKASYSKIRSEVKAARGYLDAGFVIQVVVKNNKVVKVISFGS